MFKIIPGFESDTIIARSPAVQEQALISYDSSYPDGVNTSDTAVRAGTTSEFSETIQDEETAYSADTLFQRINILPLVWLVGAVIFGIYVFISNFRLWRIIKSQRPLTQEKVLELLEDCKKVMNIQTVVAVVATDKVKSPALFGFIRPRLLLPNGMIEDFSYDQLRYVFLHELAHLKRHDIFIGWVMAILQILHWFNPLVFLAFHRMRADRELACDGLALSQMNVDEPKMYGRTIVNLLEKFSQFQILPAVAGILESKSQMKRRITMIAQFKKSTYRPSMGAVIFMLLLGIVVLTSPGVKSEAAAKSDDSKVLAGEFVSLLLNQEYGRARENFDSKLKDGMSETQLQETWGGILEQAGAFKNQLGVRKEKFLASDILFVTCEFENGPLDVKIVFDASKNITSLTFVPTPEDMLEKFKRESAEPTPTKDIGPIVLETNPSVYANDVEPGYKKITVTFDRPMMNQSWSWVGSGEMFPEIKGKPSYDFAKRKCTIRTNLEPGKVYRIGINSPSHKFFQTLEQVPAVPYVILFATKDKDGRPTPIPEEYLSEAKQINSVTESARPVDNREKSRYSKAISSGEITLSHDDNSSAGKRSIAGSGHGVLFETGGPQSTLTAVRIFCSRYGYPQPPREDFHILLCDENAKIIEDFAFPYSKIQRGDPKWVTLKVKATELPSKFYIFLSFNPEQRKGVYVHYDQEGSGNSFTGLPGRSINTFEGGDWMIQAVIKQQADSNAAFDVEPESPARTVKDVTKKNYLGQTNFPEIVKLEPANNTANVAPGLEYITVTFDRPMRGGYSWVNKGNCPKIEKIEWIEAKLRPEHM
jgi:beta-lactamase regulating signal transducer with metallopeptidase domain